MPEGVLTHPGLFWGILLVIEGIWGAIWFFGMFIPALFERGQIMEDYGYRGARKQISYAENLIKTIAVFIVVAAILLILIGLIYGIAAGGSPPPKEPKGRPLIDYPPNISLNGIGPKTLRAFFYLVYKQAKVVRDSQRTVLCHF